MSRTNSRATASKNRKHSGRNPVAFAESGEILTLAEAAVYLRIGNEDVLRLVQEQNLPGRCVGEEWRFLKEALRDWLRSPTPGMQKETFWQTHFGALKDDPYLQEYLAESDRRHAAREGR
jgi:excisionase family DNA binding protein